MTIIDPIGEIGKRLRVRSVSPNNRIRFFAVDYGPVFRIATNNEREIWRAGGQTVYDGRPSLSVREYIPVEWWGVKKINDEYMIERIWSPIPRGKARQAIIKEYIDEA